MNLNDDETWELLTLDERLQIVANYIDIGKAETIQGRIKELYDIEEMANLYKEIYHTEEQTEQQGQEFEEKTINQMTPVAKEIFAEKVKEGLDL